MESMKWEHLLSPRRLKRGQNPVLPQDKIRSRFEQDYTRILFSSPFRTMQNKTQVFPLPKQDFVHNRLTHSLEVSSVGRTLGKTAGQLIIDDLEKGNPLFTEQMVSPADFGDIVSAACLAHDIGNPPFGHAGENAISSFFSRGRGQQFIQHLSTAEQNDFTDFEGNALAFRKLTYTNPIASSLTGGISLTAATLGAFMKYPCVSHAKEKGAPAHRKKYGCFQSELQSMEETVKILQLNQDPDAGFVSNCRHPLAWLTEAADDICYLVIDLEDAFRLGKISFDEAYNYLGGKIEFRARGENIKKIYDKVEKIGYLRSTFLNQLIEEISDIFKEHYQAIMLGTHTQPLSELIRSAAHLKELKSFSRERIYNDESILKIEIAGYEVLGGLLEMFLDAFSSHAPTQLHARILALLPDFIRNTPPDDPYERVINIVDFVAGTSDTQAIQLYRQLKGIEL